MRKLVATAMIIGALALAFAGSAIAGLPGPNNFPHKGQTELNPGRFNNNAPGDASGHVTGDLVNDQRNPNQGNAFGDINN